MSLSILYILEAFPSEIHPNQVHILENGLRHGADITIIADGQLGTTYPPRVDELGLRDRTYYMPVNGLGLGDLARGLRTFATPQHIRGAIRLMRSGVSGKGFRRRLKNLARARLLGKHFDLVHARYIPGAFEYLILSQVENVPLIVTFGGMPPAYLQQFRPEMLAAVFSQAKLVLANTRFAARQLAGLGCAAEKIKVLYQGVRLEDFPFKPRSYPHDGKLLMLTVARLSEEKGIEYGIRAVAELRKKFPRIEYRIVGPGPYRATLEALAGDLGLREHVTFAGIKNGPALTAEFEAAHIYLLPSVIIRDAQGKVLIEEIQGVTLQEAQASGALAIGTRIGGLAEVIEHGETGFLVPERDASAIAELIVSLMADAHGWRAIQQKARARVERDFNMHAQNEKLWSIYEELVTSRTAAR
jgi:colanic acid/amylovoran biosynthesis glycosyltransferase